MQQEVKEPSNHDHTNIFYGLNYVAKIQPHHLLLIIGVNTTLGIACYRQAQLAELSTIVVVDSEQQKSNFIKTEKITPKEARKIYIRNKDNKRLIGTVKNCKIDVVANCINKLSNTFIWNFLHQKTLTLQFDMKSKLDQDQIDSLACKYSEIDLDVVVKQEGDTIRKIIKQLQSFNLIQGPGSKDTDTSSSDSLDSSDSSESDLGSFETDSSESENVSQEPPDNDKNYSFQLVGSFTIQGIRHANEDRYTVLKNYSNCSPNEDERALSFFGIYDGHGGSEVADYCCSNMHNVIAKNSFFETDLKKALSESFINIDKEMEQNIPRRQGKKRQMYSGSGAVVIVVVLCDNELLVANLGDSRAVMCRDEKPLQLSVDHKAVSPEETTRITEAGGFILKQRLFGILIVSRSLGDFSLKKSENKETDYENGMLISRPDIFKYTLTKNDLFMVVASDGLYDVVENDEIILLTKKWLEIHKDCHKVAELLCAESVNRKSGDDVTVIVCVFRKWWEDI